jgi:hypothetical protein
MQRDFKAQLLDVVERYSAATGASLPTIGKEILNDTQFFKRLKGGKSCTLETATKILCWLAERWPSNEKWPRDVVRPSPEKDAA